MPAKKKTAPPKMKPPQSDAAVLALVRDLDHPRKKVLEALRKIILALSPSIHEEIKWNAPSFRTTEHFATFNLRDNDQVRLILHLGAKVKAGQPISVADPDGLLEWLGKDRALLTFDNVKEVQARRASLEAILRAWIAHLPAST